MLDTMVAISRQMLLLAQEGEWEQVDELQRKRQDLVGEGLLPEATDDHPGAVAQIETILGLDNHILQLAREQQKEIGKLLGRLNQGRQATRAYRDNSNR